MSRRNRLFAAVAVIVVALWALGKLPVLYADYLWFDSLSCAGVFTTRLWTQAALAVGIFLVTAAWLGVNVYVAAKLSPGRVIQIRGLPWMVPHPLAKRMLAIGAALAILLIALSCGAAATEHWYSVLQFLHRQAFQWPDPILGYDAGWYVFTLPVLTHVKDLAVILTLLAGAGVVATYFVGGAIGWPYARMTRPATIHVGVLACVLNLALGLKYWLDRFDLLLGQRGIVNGAGYVDVHVRMPVLAGMAIACVAAAAVVLWAGLTQRTKVAYVTVIILVFGHLSAVWSYPTFEQRFDIEPNELVREEPYIANNIRATRFAFGLADVDVHPYAASGTLTLDEVEKVTGTIDNIRIWDWRVLRETYNQIQALRPYYDFEDVDTDRYGVAGRLRQVTLTVRELDSARLDPKVQTWPNVHLFYTHGYGLVMGPVNAVTREGMPQLWISNIPPQSSIDLAVERPEIYFGELAHQYIFVKTIPSKDAAKPEFDYPVGEEARYNEYDGRAGVACDSLARRLVFAWYFGDWNILLTGSFTDRTRVIWVRQIQERVRTLAPFLHLDGDPYPVVVGGRILWVLDAYTTTNRFPYSKSVEYWRDPIKPWHVYPPHNYIRNSIKAVVDAYDGTVTFYVVDPVDPLAQAAESIFPGLFKTFAQMPAQLREHLRYPQDLFGIQAEQYLAYHMTDPRTFYNREDLWQRPRHTYNEKVEHIPAYYFIMKLPSEQEAEYILMLPFTPARKDNMVGWMAGRCDPKTYGKLIVYTFPKDRLIFGPSQVEARINQNDEISPQLTLWNQHGSRVVRGNMLIIPVGDSILYVEPLYLKSATGAIPELKRVITSYQDRIAMKDTLADALAAVFKAGPAVAAPAPRPGEKPPATPAKPPTAATAARALELYERAQNQMRDGDWASYGTTTKELGKLLKEMTAEPEKK